MILDEIAEYTKNRIKQEKKKHSFEEIKETALAMNPVTGFPFEEALKGKEIAFICEVKKASPSKGIIAKDFPYLQIAKEYEEAGASALSVLTEPKYFLGSGQYLREISKEVSIPILRKDFTVDSYQIYEAKLLGASAILLICELMEEERLSKYLEIAESLGLSALVESHTEKELDKALRAGAKIIGVNNRDLKTFQVDVNTSIRLRSLVPEEKLFVSESGIKTPRDIERLKNSKINGVLIGETLMRCSNKKRELSVLRGDKFDEN